MAAQGDRVRRTQTASHWGVYTVDTEPGTDRVLGTGGVPFDPDPSPIQASLPEVVHDRLRIDRPHVREGWLRSRGDSRRCRGAEAFMPVSWDTALELVTEALTETRSRHGNSAIYGGSYGWASAGRLHHSPSLLKRFLGLFGGYVDKSGNHSFGAAAGIMPYILGHRDITSLVVPWPEVVANTRLLVMFGGAALKNAQIDSGGAVNHETAGWFRQAREAGIEVVCVSPAADDVTDSAGPEWLPVRPNTDTALMLGLAHTLVADGRADRSFLDRCCAGYQEFERYLLGTSDGTVKNAAWASEITGVPADTIVTLARRMASTRTLVTTSWSVQRAQHGEQPVYATVALAAILGQIGLPGGGFSLGFGAVSGNTIPRPAGIPRPKMPLGENPVGLAIPVGRFTDTLLNPGGTLEHDGTTITLPEIDLVYSAGGNPFHHNTNLNRFLRGWRTPSTVIVHEPWWSPPARYADIVLPATTSMERNDIGAADLSRFWIAMERVVPPYRQARNDLDVFGELADRLGFGSAYHEDRDERAWLRHMYDGARELARRRGFDPPEFDAFWAAGRYEFPAPEHTEPLMSAFRSDPAAHPLNTPSGRIELASDRLRGYGYDDCPPHPAWLPPDEWLGAPLARRFPLHLLSHQPKTRLHSQLNQASLSRQAEIAGREPILLHPADAAERGLSDGDVVRVFNDRGAFLAGLRVSAGLSPGVAQIATGAWFDPLDRAEIGSLEKHGNPNVVTLDIGTSRLTQGSMAQTCLVEIERCDDPPPATAFDPPPIVRR